MSVSELVGRQRQRSILQSLLDSKRAELLALYGRRRVGKTHLVRNFFQPRSGTYLEVVGTRNAPAALQRRHFREAAEASLAGGQLLPDFRSWDDAFSYLARAVERRARARPDEPIVLFFDELPWLATPRSRLLESLDYYWNARLSKLPQVKLILCGSAASWMLQRIVHARGGLHNRLTRQMRLMPFSLRETVSYLRAQGLRYKHREILELYMAFGGVPYYLSLLDRGESVAESVGRLCFENNGPLHNEFIDVFASLFDRYEEHLALIRALASRRHGLTRNELIDVAKVSSGGGLNRRLQELEEAGFIARVAPYRARVKNTVFRVIDEHSLFFLSWMERAPGGVLGRGASSYWQSIAQTPSYRAWAGYAFEGICFKHARELQRALGIENLVTDVGTWRFRGAASDARSAMRRGGSLKRVGAQIDLLFERRDAVINICEMKYSREPFVVTKAYARELKSKLEIFEQRTRTRKRLVLTLICTAGLKKNSWSEDLVDRVLDTSALFRPAEA